MAPRARGGSDIWFHFTKVDGKGKCRYCESFVSMSGGNSTGNLKRHLRKKHPTVSFSREEGSGDEHENSEIKITPHRRGCSVVWYHFIKAEGKAKCRYCKTQLSTAGGNVAGNLRRHLKKKHPTVLIEQRPDGSGDEHENSENIFHTENADNDSPEYFENGDDSPVVYMVSSSQKRQRKRKLHISSIESNANKLNRVSEDYSETSDDEFELFCKSLSYQLRKMPVERALICQEKLQSVMTQERLQQLRTSTNEQEIIVDYQQESEVTVPVEFP